MLSGSGGVLVYQMKAYLACLFKLISTAQVVIPPRNDLTLRPISNDEHERCIVIPSLPL